MSTTPTGSQHGGESETEPTTPRQPPPREPSEPDHQEEPRDHRPHPAPAFERLNGSVPPAAALKSVKKQEINATSRATSEPLAKDMLLLAQQQQNGRDSPSASSQLPDFDWEDFEARYERALEDCDEHEREVLRDAEDLGKYFRAWASAASVQDNERAVKRLQTRQRFVNISEEKMAQKQRHYKEVVGAFESALALLRSTA